MATFPTNKRRHQVRKRGTLVLFILSGGLLLLIVSLLYVGDTLQQDGLLGVWRGEAGREVLDFTFDNDGTCVLTFSNRTSGTNRVIRGRFEVDLSKRPIPLSIRGIALLDHPLHTIIEIRGDTLLIAPFAPRRRVRPVSLSQQRTMILTRTGEKPTFDKKAK